MLLCSPSVRLPSLRRDRGSMQYCKKDDDAAAHRSSNVCALCGQELVNIEAADSATEKLFELPCKHKCVSFSALLSSPIICSPLCTAALHCTALHCVVASTKHFWAAIGCAPRDGRRLHEFCVRGWVIVGKKDSCPFCACKVPLKEIVGTTPWNPQSMAWMSVLDYVRYTIVWYPVLLLILNFTLLTGHKQHAGVEAA